MIPETKKLIAKFFETIEEGEKIIEIKRNNLNKCYDFEPFILFNRLDQFRNNYLTEETFINFLKINNIEVTINESKYLILFYDSDFTQNLNYNQFLNLVLSKDYYEIRNSINSKIEENLNNSNYNYIDNSDNSISYISYETEKLFSELLQSEFDLIKKLDLLLSQIKFNGDFSLSELFNEISISGIVISSKLNTFLSENDINLNKNDIKLILKRCDIKKNGRVDLLDLEKIFYFPFSSPPSTFNSRKNTPKLYKNLNKIPVLNINKSNSNFIRNEYNKYYVSNSKNKSLQNSIMNNDNNNSINMNDDNSNINYSNINNSNMNYSNINNSNINNSNINTDDDYEKKYENQFKKTFFNKNLYLNDSENDNFHKYNKIKNPFRLSYNNSTKSIFRNNQSNYNNDSFSIDKRNINKKIITQYKFPNQKNTSYNTPNFSNSFSTQFNSEQETFQRSTSQANIKHNHIPNKIKIIPLCNYNKYKQNFKHNKNNINLNKAPRFQNYIFNTENYKNIPKKISTTLSLRLSPIRKTKNNSKYNNNNLNNSQINVYNNKIKEFTEFDLLNFLQNLIEIEFEIEKEKIEISNNKDYNIEDIFSYFETNNTKNNILSPKDLLNGFHNLNLNFNINDLNLILSRFDLLNLGGLSYPDFFDMLVPFDKNIRDEVENRLSFGLNINTFEQLRNLFILILKSEKRIFEMKKYIKSLNNVDLNSIFNTISFNNNFANDDNLENYFKVNGIFYNQRGIDLLFIRLDRDRDGNFTYDDLRREVFL